MCRRGTSMRKEVAAATAQRRKFAVLVA